MNLPNVDPNLIEQPTFEKVQAKELAHPPRILLLYGLIGNVLTVALQFLKLVESLNILGQK